MTDLAAALEKSEQKRRAAPLDKDKEPEKYWPAVLELAALAGELSRQARRPLDRDPRPAGAVRAEVPRRRDLAPTVVAQKIVEGVGADSLQGADAPPA